MLTDIAIWGGIVGMAVAVISIIVVLIIKKDIKDVLNLNVVLFDQNFMIKKQAIEKCLKLLDDLNATPAVAKNPEFIRRAKESYNELICVLNNIANAYKFLDYTLNKGEISAAELNNFKISMRKDIGLNLKHAKKQSTKMAKPANSLNSINNFSATNSTSTTNPTTRNKNDNGTK